MEGVGPMGFSAWGEGGVACHIWPEWGGAPLPLKGQRIQVLKRGNVTGWGHPTGRGAGWAWLGTKGRGLPYMAQMGWSSHSLPLKGATPPGT